MKFEYEFSAENNRWEFCVSYKNKVAYYYLSPAFTPEELLSGMCRVIKSLDEVIENETSKN